MKVVLATPLFPPEIGGSARYAKELAQRLSANHTVAIVAFATHPEEVPGTILYSISKRSPKMFRLIMFTVSLMQATHRADMILILNGRSTELAALMLHFLFGRRYILCIADSRASEHERMHFIGRNARKNAHHIITSTPPDRPEIIPLDPYPEAAFATYKSSWQRHIEEIEKLSPHHHDTP